MLSPVIRRQICREETQITSPYVTDFSVSAVRSLNSFVYACYRGGVRTAEELVSGGDGGRIERDEGEREVEDKCNACYAGYSVVKEEKSEVEVVCLINSEAGQNRGGAGTPHEDEASKLSGSRVAGGRSAHAH